MPKFHILEMRKGKPGFREVTGEAVEIGEGIQAFRPVSLLGTLGFLYDSDTGAKLSLPADRGAEDTHRCEKLLKENGPLWFAGLQMAFSAKYGLPPEVTEIIQEPQSSGEIQTCSRETSCSHH